MQASPPGRKNAEGILHYTAGPAGAVVEDLLLFRQHPVGEGFHHIRSEGERVISHHEVGLVLVISGQWGGRWQADGILSETRFQGG